MGKVSQSVRDLKQALQAVARPDRVPVLQNFFKTGPGQYAEGDVLIGVYVPDSRKIARRFRRLPLADIAVVLDSPIHEERLTALFILVHCYQAADVTGKEAVYDFYLNHTHRINNWDLVDISCHKIVGDWLLERDRSVLHRLAKSANLWERRISMVSTYAFIRAGDLDDTFNLARVHLHDKHDLMHKAVGWMLREAGKQDILPLRAFLDEHATAMPRTMLRYAIERLDKTERQHYLQLKP